MYDLLCVLYVRPVYCVQSKILGHDIQSLPPPSPKESRDQGRATTLTPYLDGTQLRMVVASFLWHPSNALAATARVAALPFHPRDAMLLGERMQLHLYEPECRAALCRALVDGHRCFGQLLTASDDDPEEVMPLLRVLRSTEHPEQGLSVHVQCVGRLNVLEADRPETRDGDGGGACRDGGGRCLMTTVAPYQDVHAEREPRELVFQRLESLHASCCDLHAQIEEISQGDVPPVVIPPDVVYSWGHETYLPSFEQPLHGIFSQRRRSLCEMEMDEPDLNPYP